MVRRGLSPATRCPDDPELTELSAALRESDLEARLLRAQVVRYEGVPRPWPTDGPSAEMRQATLLARLPELVAGSRLRAVDCSEDPCLVRVDFEGRGNTDPWSGALTDASPLISSWSSDGSSMVVRVGGEDGTRVDFRAAMLARP